ncbi:MAG: hypothetical protein Q8M01_19355 [Rubrivivax sp.]|nr:hypothetical protein [Rubrivivax sp.]
MTGANDLARMVPGYDFLQSLIKGAGAAVPGMGQWIAPTLDPEVLDKRIGELRTVQFWLEQNARLLATTIQALEVQRMTLSTLQSMNLPLADLGDALRIKSPAAPAPAPPPAPEPAAAPAAADADAGKAAAGAVDPMQWWGALTKQFTEIASQALKDTGSVVASPATTPAPKPASRSAKPAPAKKAAARKRAAAPRQRSG